MSSRLQVFVPNKKSWKRHFLELGSIDDPAWEPIKQYWFNGSDHGLVYREDLEQFYKELVAINETVEDKLYNLDNLSGLVNLKLDLYFTSF